MGGKGWPEPDHLNAHGLEALSVFRLDKSWVQRSIVAERNGGETSPFRKQRRRASVTATSNKETTHPLVPPDNFLAVFVAQIQLSPQLPLWLQG